MINVSAHTPAFTACCGVNRCIPFMFNLTPNDARVLCGHHRFTSASHAYSYRYM